MCIRDSSRLGLENELLENKSGRIFCILRVYLKKSCQQLWVRVNEHFILFIHHIWGETVIWGAVFIIQTSDKMQYFTIFQDKYSEPSKHTWAFSKTVQKISKNPYTASRFSLLTSAKFSVSIKRVTLPHNKEFIVFIFHLMVLKRCVILKSVWYEQHFEYSCKRCLWTTENKLQSD